MSKKDNQKDVGSNIQNTLSKNINESRVDNIQRFVRWQNITIKQLGFTTNLILTITVGVIGFVVNKIADENFKITSNGKALFIIGLFSLFLSFIMGIVINLTRLYDFRKTTRIVRKKMKNEKDSELYVLKKATECLGKASWIIFRIQIISFAFALTFILLSFIIIYSDKLF